MLRGVDTSSSRRIIHYKGCYRHPGSWNDIFHPDLHTQAPENTNEYGRTGVWV